MDLRMLRMRASFNLDRLLREVHVMQQLEHPYIVRLHLTIQTHDALLLVMELVGGIDLFEKIIAHQGLDEDTSRDIFLQLCLCLRYMHSKGIVHRDVKPENILLQGPQSRNVVELDEDVGAAEAEVGADNDAARARRRGLAPGTTIKLVDRKSVV